MFFAHVVIDSICSIWAIQCYVFFWFGNMVILVTLVVMMVDALLCLPEGLGFDTWAEQ